MKVLHEKSYKYLGVVQDFHAFECVKVNFDSEILLLERAKMIKEDGTCVYFDPIHSRSDRRNVRVDLSDCRLEWFVRELTSPESSRVKA